MAGNKRLGRALAVALFFVLVTGIAIAPLSVALNSRVSIAAPDWGRPLDYYHFHWNLWWLRHAVQTGQNIWYTDMALAPFTHNLSYHSLAASMLPFYVVLEPPLGHLRAANTITWLNMALAGILMAAYLRWRGIRWGIALVGGVALSVSPYMLDRAASGHYNLLPVWWMPLVLLTWEQTARTRRIRWAALTGLVLWGMWFTDTVDALWGGLLLGPLGAIALWRGPDRRARLHLVALGALALLITLGLSWLCGPLRPALDFETEQLPPADLYTLRFYSLAPRSLLLPSLGRAQQVGGEHDETLGLTLVVLIVLALAIRTRSRERWVWLWVALPPLILAMGPDVEVLGLRLPLPFRLIHELFGGQMRTPIRFLPPAMVALIIFLAHSYHAWLRAHPRLPGRALISGVLFLLLVDFGAFVPLRTLPALKPYDFHRMMGQEHYDDYDYVVLDVPSGPWSGWRNVGTHPEAMVYGITHGKRQVSGMLARVPLEQHLFYETDPLLGWLTDSRPLDAGAAASSLRRFVGEWPLGYVIVHLGWLEPARAQEALAFFNAQDSVCPVTVERDAVLYRTVSHPKGCPPRIPPQAAPGEYTLALGESAPAALLPDAPFVGHGWYPPEDIGGERARWAGDGEEALLYISLPPGSAYTMTLRAVAFHEPRTVRVVVGNLVNGELVVARLGRFIVAPGDWSEHTLTLPADLLTALDGDLVISLAADGAISTKEANLSADARPLTLACDWVRFAAAPGG